MSEFPLEDAARLVRGFGVGSELTRRISSLESAAQGRSGDEIAAWLKQEQVDAALWTGARTIKGLAGQINTVLHAVGMLLSLPHILGEGEVIDSVSIGAGNTGRAHDLETNRQIAEFKFIDWQGGAETIRQNGIFYDIFGLASDDTNKRRVLYLLGVDHAERFLRGRRAIRSVLSRNRKVSDAFYERHGKDAYETVSAYWATVEHLIEIQDLRQLVPAFAAQP